MSETLEIDLDLPDARRRLLEKMLSGGAARKRQVDGVVKRSVDERQPMSLEQQNVWLHSEMASSQPLYNEPITIHRRGSFDLGLMEKSFNEVLRRHEAWRTSFQIVDGEAVPVVHDDFSVRLPLVDLTGMPAAGREAEALRLASEDALTPIDLSAPPLFRARISKLAEDDHRLHLTLHHIIFDGVSLYRVVVPELSAIYDAYASGRLPALDPPGLQYGDYAIWRERHTSSDAVAKQMDYWRQNLRGPLPMLQLPSDRPRPVAPTYSGAMEKFVLSGPLSEALKTFSRNEGVTLYMTLLAAFKALLHRYSGQEDIVIGGVTDTRQRPELQNVVGYFLNSLVLRTRPSGQSRFREFLAQARDTVVGALSASEVPFDHIVREVQPKRDLGAHPLFQVLFSVQPPAPILAEGWDLTQMDVAAGTAKFDLYLELEERGEGIIGRFLYSTDLFDAATIERMIGHWRTILEAIVADPDCLLERLPLLTDSETQQLLMQWNNTARPFPRATIHQLFEDQVARTPNATAVECDGKTLTYLELNRRANALANRLREQGATTGTLVAICVERSVDMLTGLLAILKTGSAYLPLDPGFPQQRLAMILENAQPALVLTQPFLVDVLPKSDAKIVFCDGGNDRNAVNGPTIAPTHMSSQDIAYVIYTSGSTGTPKGVEISHHAAVNLLSSMKQEPGCGASDALLAVTTISFDIAALELFMPLLAGGRVIVATRDDTADPRRLARLIERSACTMMQATPATWRALLEAGWSGKKGLKILCGGESLPRELADRLLDRAGDVWNMYGPTETTIWSTTHKVVRAGRSVPIGRPIANTRIYILDARENPVPVGVVGELCIGGDGVARGYHKRDDLTRERFVTVAAASGERIYRTGDLARYRPDGTIECLGRNDQQVKIRGFRVELEDIEAALARHPALAGAALKAWPDASGELALCAYVVKRGAAAPDVADLRQFLRQSLPEYMIPSHYIWMAALPTTPNAKVDRNALRKPEQTAPPSTFVAPRNDVERKLVDIWKNVLQVESVGVTDNFFDLGGHSLLFARLVRRLEDAFSVRLSMSAVFQAATLESMAALLANPSGAKRSRATVLQAQGSQPPFFWLSEPHAALSLVAEIEPEQPFITVALDPAEKQELSSAPRLADIGSRLVKIIRAEQPHGPYFVGGYCTSGIVAFEVASQLVAAGCDVGLVVMLHAANPVLFGWRQKLALELDRLKHGLRKNLSMASKEKWRALTERLWWNGRRLLNEGRKPQDESHAFDDVQDRAAYVYVPKVYPGAVALLQPAKRPRALDYRSAWAGLVTGKFIAVDISGSHATLMERPHVADLGAKISACLREAQERRHQAPPLGG